MIKYLIVDDESMAHDIIEGYCNALPNMQLMQHCYDAFEAIEYLQQHRVDLIFLDINMPKLKGFDFLKTLTTTPKIIVTTAYAEYALEGYALRIEDYLLKPFGFERFLQAINKAFSSPAIQTTPFTPHQNTIPRIFLKSDKKYIQITTNQIQYLEALGNYVKVVTTLETITVRDKISDLLATLPTADFLQAHKSFVVSIPHIKKIEGNRVFVGEEVIPIGKMYRNNVMNLVKTANKL